MLQYRISRRRRWTSITVATVTGESLKPHQKTQKDAVIPVKKFAKHIKERVGALMRRNRSSKCVKALVYGFEEQRLIHHLFPRQCVREGYVDKVKQQAGEGCNINGHVEVNRVAGNLHFAPWVDSSRCCETVLCKDLLLTTSFSPPKWQYVGYFLVMRSLPFLLTPSTVDRRVFSAIAHARTRHSQLYSKSARR